jgi:hypothetical protein
VGSQQSEGGPRVGAWTSRQPPRNLSLPRHHHGSVVLVRVDEIGVDSRAGVRRPTEVDN